MNAYQYNFKEKIAAPAGWSVLQIVVPWTSVSLPDHIGCSGGSYEVTNSEAFPGLQHHIITSFESPIQNILHLR